MWKDLTLQQKSDIMNLGIQNGITDLKEIRRIYNTQADGGYEEWKKQINRYKHLDIDKDNTYDYQRFFEDNPEKAWNILNKDSKEGFTNEYKTVFSPTFQKENTSSETFDKGGPIDYTHNRFPITTNFDVHPYLDPSFNPKEIGKYGDIEYMSRNHDTLPYYNNYQKPDSLLGKSVIVYNNNLGKYTNESIALDALSHGLREYDKEWNETYLPMLNNAFNKDAEYWATKENPKNKEEFKQSYIDGIVRNMLVKDEYRDALNYQPKEGLINDYNHMTPLQQNALTQVYNYIFPYELPEVEVIKNKKKK